jgi:hypothetical protein
MLKRTLWVAAAATAMTLPLAGCGRTESHDKETKVKTTQTPDGGTKTTKETTERKVESQPR